MAKIIPDHWKENSWEEKAQENPLYAVMTMPDMKEADPEAFSEKHLDLFFAKGRRLAERWVLPSLENAPESGHVVEYGCGAGRILNALVERNIPCHGVDISPTMLKHCALHVPKVESLICLDETGTIDLHDGCARLVYSYAVVQHIDKLSVYTRAIEEMCRLLKPSGMLALQVNCEDYSYLQDGVLGRTENFEDYSLHYNLVTNKCALHENTTWSGVYVGLDYLKSCLERCGTVVEGIEPFNTAKPRAQFVFARKRS